MSAPENNAGLDHPNHRQLHASCVAFDGRGILILGASGSGKTTLAWSLIALGGALVSDDRTDITLQQGWPVASAPSTIRGKIEARGIGVLAADVVDAARVHLVVDMDQVERHRAPPDRTYDLFGVPICLVHKVERSYFAIALRQYLVGGKLEI